MKKTIKKALSVMLVVVIMLTAAPLSGFVGLELPEWLDFSIKSSATTTSGTCGENLTWSIDFLNDTLTISGTGEMFDYYDAKTESFLERTWSNYYIEKVIIDSGVTSIGEGAFVDCTDISEVVISNTVVSIDNYAFQSCCNLTEISIPNGVVSIGKMAFMFCSGLEEITIPNSVTSIGEYAFIECTSLKTVSLSSSLYRLSEGMFACCSNLESVVIHDSVEILDDGVFSDCTSLTEISLGQNTLIIGDSVFHGCTKLDTIFIPEKVTHIGVNSLFCSKIIVDENNRNYSSDSSGILFNKNKTELLQYPVLNKRTSYTVPNGVVSIGDFSFLDSLNLRNIIISEGVTMIGDCAFFGCTNLVNVTIPSSVQIIDDNVFDDCICLSSISVDENNQLYCSDEYGVLFNENKTELIRFPSGNATMEYIVPDSVEIICDSAFDDANNLTSITISNCVKTIGYSAFYVCDNLKDVYYSGTEESWNSISFDEYNDALLAANIHFNTHIHNYLETVTLPTCTEKGYTTYNCNCGDSYIDDYIDAIGHTSKTITIEPTCTERGMKYEVCQICGETLGTPVVFSETGHTLEWIVVVEPTSENDGMIIQRCIICYETVAEEIIPKIETTVVLDEETGVSMEYNNSDYDGEVAIVVEESYDGTAFDVIDTSLNVSQKFIYDITMTVDGLETQPKGSVIVKIPLPDDYDPGCSFVYHVNTETGTVEKMNAEYEDGYLVFETTHFSFYAVVEEASDIEYDFDFYIQEPSRTTIRNRDRIFLYVNFDGERPEGSYIEWKRDNSNFYMTTNSIDDTKVCVTAENKGYTTFTAILYDADGKFLAKDSVTLYSKSGFFDKIGGFFRSLFGTDKLYEY